MKNFTKHADVVVAGGGVAGVAAAVSAARAGCKVIMIEKTIWPGGLATSGLVIHYLPICDGVGTVVFKGMAEEFLHRSIHYGPGKIPENWEVPESTHRYRSYFSPAAFVMAMDELLEQEGIEVWYDTIILGAVKEEGKVVGVEVFNKSGRGEIRGSVTIDATGDADVARSAGEDSLEGDSWLSCWSVQIDMLKSKEAVEANDGFEMLQVLKRNGGKDDFTYGLSGKKVTDFTLAGRKLMRDYYAREQQERGKDQIYPLLLPTQAPLRKTLGMKGRLVLTADDAWKAFPDTVGVMTNAVGAGGVQIPVWEIPYRTLLPQQTDGLLVAGRAFAADGKAWEVSRNIPACVATGEIAGAAAALSLSSNREVVRVDLDSLRRMLKKQGMNPDLEDLYGSEWQSRVPEKVRPPAFY